jgi:DNA repair exonuclease SbcCD nuclease subunit
MEVNKDTIWFYIIDKVIIVIILGVFAYRNNRKLEKFKNDLLKENRIFEDNYLAINEFIVKIKRCELYLNKIDFQIFLFHGGHDEYSEANYANTLDSFVNECNNIEVIAQTKISFLNDELVSKFQEISTINNLFKGKIRDYYMEEMSYDEFELEIENYSKMVNEVVQLAKEEINKKKV